MLESCVDAIVLGFHLDEGAAVFELVCSFEGPIPGAVSFVRFRFAGVRGFVRVPGRDRELQQARGTFVLRDVQGTWSIQRVRARKPGPHREVAISMGEAFGGFELRYDDATHEVVHLYAKQKGADEWDYFEVDTGRPVGFYNPFAAEWADRR
jgi:hypothetical protein